MGQKSNGYLDIRAEHPEVTGSCFDCALTLPDKTTKFLIDCGLFQENQYNSKNKSFSFKPHEYDFILITHAHADHIGRIPLLYAKGFKGNIHATQMTNEIIPISLRNTCKIFQNDAKIFKQKPLYSLNDVEVACKHLISHQYNRLFQINNNISIAFIGNGHILGAASIFIRISYPGQEDMHFLFSGDYSPKNMLFKIPSIPEFLKETSHLTVIQESTYGTTSLANVDEVFENNIREAVQKRHDILIPLFALGRFQEAMYKMYTFVKKKIIPDEYLIVLDGKLAKEYCNLYLKHLNLLKKDAQNFYMRRFRFVTDKSRKNILFDPTPKIVLTTGGMGSFGPVVEYFKYMLPRKDVLIHFLGYTAEKSRGREILTAKPGEAISIQGLRITKNAKVVSTSEFSSHAKLEQLLEFYSPLQKIDCIGINHGQTQTQIAYRDTLLEKNISKDVIIFGDNATYRFGPYGLIKSFKT